MKKIALLTLLIFSYFLNSSIAHSYQLPRFLGSEKKFRTYIYNPNDVYRFVGHYTYQSFLEFEGGETIETITMGNTDSWLYEKLGNRLFLKPVEDDAETNMTVLTNKRVYQFELIAKEAKNIDDEDLIFVVKFVYPDEKDKNILEFPKIPVSDEPNMKDLSRYNFNYEFTGEPGIAPVKIFDDGKFTYLQFARTGIELPAVFSVDSSGYESLVNFRVAGDYYIIETTAAQFTLRNGNEIVCIYNNTRLSSGKSIPQRSNAPSGFVPGGSSSPMPRSPFPGQQNPFSAAPMSRQQ